MISYIDTSYAMYSDIKSYFGASVSFGINVVLSQSTKQKLNVGSSIKAKLIGVTNILQVIEHYRLFM